MAKRKGFADAIGSLDLDKDRHSRAVDSGSVESVSKGYKRSDITEKVIHQTDPKRCRPWKYADRDALWFSEENCADLIHGFKTVGQEMPGLARRIKDDPNFDFEIVWGNRRRWTAEFLNMPFQFELTTDDDAKCFLRMDSENDDRKDISPFERACSYRRMIDEAVFPSVRQLAEARNISNTYLNRCLKAAKLKTTTLIDLFTDIRDIPVKPAETLMGLWESSTENQGAILAKAHSIKEQGGSNWTAPKIIKLLILSTKDKPMGNIKKEYEVDGKITIVAEMKKGKVHLAIDKDGISKRDLKKLVTDVLADFI